MMNIPGAFIKLIPLFSGTLGTMGANAMLVLKALLSEYPPTQ